MKKITGMHLFSRGCCNISFKCNEDIKSVIITSYYFLLCINLPIHICSVHIVFNFVETEQCSWDTPTLSGCKWWLYHSPLCRKGNWLFSNIWICGNIHDANRAFLNLFQVTYDVVGFCERNRDVLFKDLIELMQTSEK